MILLQAVAKVIGLILLWWNLFLCCKSLTSKWTNNDLHVQLHPLLHWRPELPTLKGQVDIVYVGEYLVRMDILAFLDDPDLHLPRLLGKLISVDYFVWPQ